MRDTHGRRKHQRFTRRHGKEKHVTNGDSIPVPKFNESIRKQILPDSGGSNANVSPLPASSSLHFSSFNVNGFTLEVANSIGQLLCNKKPDVSLDD